jgi:hypothetical protein
VNDVHAVKGFEGEFLTGVLVGKGSLVLFLEEAQVIVQCPFEVASSAGVAIGHGEIPLTSTHLFELLNRRVAKAEMSEKKILQLTFENGLSLSVLPEKNGLESYVMTVGGEIYPVILE